MGVSFLMSPEWSKTSTGGERAIMIMVFKLKAETKQC